MGLKKSAARIFGLICLILLDIDIVIFSLGFLDGRKNGMNSYSYLVIGISIVCAISNLIAIILIIIDLCHECSPNKELKII